MKTLTTAAISLFLLTLLLGVVYPLFMFGVGQLFFRKEANGSLIVYQEKVVGSAIIAQNFTSARYFHPRPSLAGDKGFDAANSSGSNLGPTSQKLIDTLRSRAAAYRAENGLASDAEIPAEAVTASGSGLDPHISLANALLQAHRIATARAISEGAVISLIADKSEAPFLGLFGEYRVNVLLLNLALDQ